MYSLREKLVWIRGDKKKKKKKKKKNKSAFTV